MRPRLVVVGGDAAGMSAASQARRRRGPDDLEIVAFEMGSFTSYSACGIPYWVGGLVEDRDSLIARTPERFREHHDIDVHLHHEVVTIDPAGQRIEVVDRATTTARWEHYDDLVIATGAAPHVPEWLTEPVRGVHLVHTLADGQRIRADLASRPIRTVVIVGGGNIGVEMAEVLHGLDLDLTLLHRPDSLLPRLDPDLTASLQDRMQELGIDCHVSTPAVGLATRDGVVVGVETEDTLLPADLVIIGIGVDPRVDMAAEAGIRIGTAGGIETDQRQRTSVEGVWSAGDCAQAMHRVSREPVVRSLGTTANKQGRVAGINLGGGDAVYPGTLATGITRFADLGLARTGLTTTEARAAGLDADHVTIESTTVAGYFPGTRPLMVRLTYERPGGRVLGGQVVGGADGAKRIDTIAAATWTEMEVGELLDLDLAYAPPFSSVWDPVAVAARKAWQQLQKATPNPS